LLFESEHVPVPFVTAAVQTVHGALTFTGPLRVGEIVTVNCVVPSAPNPAEVCEMAKLVVLSTG
jgi:acyl-CoA hydrolase